MSVDESLHLISSIFLKDSGVIGQTDIKYNGFLLLNTCDAIKDEEPVIEKLCSLPLNDALFMDEYMELVNLISKTRDISNLEPVDIRCDTTICHLRIDISPIHDPPGILFAFQDIQLLQTLITIFQKTSPFGSNTKCINTIKDTIINSGREKQECH